VSNTVYEIVTERVIKQLEQGNVPWRKPWSAAWAPKNAVSRRDYHGVNYVLLSCDVRRWECPYFATKKQVYEDLDGKIQSDQWKHSQIVTFWKLVNLTEEDEATGEETPTGKRVPFLRYYRVWNLAQTEGISWTVEESAPVNPIVACDRVVEGYNDAPRIAHDGGNEASYRKLSDSVHMPPRDAFFGSEEYYATLFHELVHSTGHGSRLDRDMTGGKYSKAYAREELCAEMGAALLLGTAGIMEDPLLQNSGAYLRSWISALTEDPRCVTIAAGKAQKAADWVLGEREEITEPVRKAA